MVAQRSLNRPHAQGVLYVHSSPRALCPHVEWAVGRVLEHGVDFSWEDQPILRGCQRAEFFWEGPAGSGARIASALRGWDHIRYEVTEDAAWGADGGRWMYTPSLGIFAGQVDSAGNFVVQEDRIRRAMSTAGSSVLDLQHALTEMLGQAWDDELEPFRHASDTSPVVWLHKVG
jgi:Protein of unknown function (DUF3145)